jgi:spoIIIJ-associated protein
MTQEREFYAATVDEAVGKAANDLGLPSEEISYTVLDEGNSGFLGIGARDARILVTTTVSTQEVSIDDEEPLTEEPLTEEPLATVPDDDAGADSPDEEPPVIGASAETSSLAEVYGDSSDSEQEEAPQELLDKVRELVSTTLDAMDFDAQVEVYDAGGFIAVDVASEDTALFIGQKGETIDALQYLVNVAAFKERDFFKRIVLDAEGYRQRRVEAIQGMAHRTARKALRERRTVEMPPMNSSERRVVHLYLSENPNVTTESEGTGDGRRVMVSPS